VTDRTVLNSIRNRLPISAVVGRRVTFDRRKSQPARGDFWACCPFHKENTPSFHCNDRRGIYHCFGCGATGDHFKFVTETEGLTFGEAVERLAGDAGVALPQPDPREREREMVRVDLAGACEIAAKFFEGRLRSPEGKPARDYLVRRGLTERTVVEFRMGYAPAERDALKRHLVQNGVTEETAIAAGLLIKPEDGRGSYDRFRGRVMIPIHDERGRVVAFGGRTLDPEGQPKYLNSPETPLFHKGTMLFNVHRAREAAHKSGTIIVTEGYLDAIAVFQAGIRNVVAALGTAFTEDHIAKLWRFAPEPVICFDGDKAGVSAAHRAIDRILPALKSGFSFNFCFLPDGQDPDDLVRAGGADALLAEIGKARPLSEVLWERETSGARIDTPERKAALEARLHDLIRTIPDHIVARAYRDWLWRSMRGRAGVARHLGPDLSWPARTTARSGELAELDEEIVADLSAVGNNTDDREITRIMNVLRVRQDLAARTAAGLIPPTTFIPSAERGHR
jgi:DNA primase